MLEYITSFNASTSIYFKFILTHIYILIIIDIKSVNKLYYQIN